MRLKLIFILLIVSAVANAQNYFAIQANKDSMDGFMPFYDTEDSQIEVMVSITPSISLEKHSLSYAIQPKHKLNGGLDIYGEEIKLTENNFDLRVPLNDTFIKSGNYRLVFRLINKSDKKLVQEKDFHFQALRKPNSYYKALGKLKGSVIQYRATHSASNIDIAKIFVAKYDLKRIKANVEALDPIAEKAEQGAIKGLIKNNEYEELQRFFYNFWFARNRQNPEAEWRLYADKLNMVSRKYAYGSLRGYQTDMGRLYLRFGPPSRKIRASSERGTRPYEVWFYAALGKFTNLNILFVQVGTQANERLIVHSTEPNFYFNPYWASQLFTDPSEQNNKNAHRVYEFFK